LIERIWTLKKARGNGNPAQFVMRLKRLISAHDIDAAKKECDLQQGSIASVLRAGLDKFQELEKHKTMDFDKKILSLQKELEDAADMELPMLEKNIIILSTIASLSTLTGLLGTVTGMVKAFAALAHSGAPDALGLATGYQRLNEHGTWMITSMLAIIFYSYVTTRIDQIMYHTARPADGCPHLQQQC
jgi:biopolymer transport protein ExbB